MRREGEGKMGGWSIITYLGGHDGGEGEEDDGSELHFDFGRSDVLF